MVLVGYVKEEKRKVNYLPLESWNMEIEMTNNKLEIKTCSSYSTISYQQYKII